MKGASLKRYRNKRDFGKTPEPKGDRLFTDGNIFVVQKHAASRLHYDLRLQIGDVLKSWAVTKGPSLDTTVRRLAVHVEEHPIEYADFEGTIPEGQYGAGSVIVWDRGTWAPMGDPEAGFARGNLKFRLAGEKLRGGWALVRVKDKEETGKSWLLVKEYDDYARPESQYDILKEQPDSVATGRSIEEISAAAKPRKKPRPAKVKLSMLTGVHKGSLPNRVPPQLATARDSPPDGDDWLHEIKFDGYRTAARIDNGDVRLLTRNGLDWTERYGLLADAIAKLRCKQAMIDGEVIVQGDNGVSSFTALQQTLSEGATERLIFYAFDLMHLDGYDLTDVPLVDRKRALAGLLAPAIDQHSQIQLSEHVVGRGPEFLEQASRMTLEGVVSKRTNATYSPRRTQTWTKTKCVNSDEFVIVGYTVSEAAGGLAALHLAEPRGDGLKYAGKVGTGFSQSEQQQLAARLEAIAAKKPAVTIPKRQVRIAGKWVAPTLVAEIEYSTRTADGILRHPVYKGLRADKPYLAAVKTESTPRKRYVTEADLASIWVTNPDRVMFGGPSKLELALYYARVGDWMLPELMHRPVSLVRCTTGDESDNFYQRHKSQGMPAPIKTIRLRDEDSRKKADYLYIDAARGLLSLAQFGAVEFHTWGCHVEKPERPDRFIVDLDPGDDLRWREVVKAALDIREQLVELGLVPFVKTTGGKGLHIVVPIVRRHTWASLRGFSESFAKYLSGKSPDRYTSSVSKRSRRGRIFIDYMRNFRGSTAVAAYSLRARQGAPVSMPLGWSELTDVEDPHEYNYATAPTVLSEREVDPWAQIDKSARMITRGMEQKLGVRY